MVSRVWLLLFWILYFGLKIICWTFRKWTSRPLDRKNDGVVSKTSKRNRFALTDSACGKKHEVRGADDTNADIDVVHARINRLENQMCGLANNMTTFQTEKSGKQIIAYLHTLSDKIDRIEQYVTATKKNDEKTTSCCAENYKMFNNLMKAFEKATDEFKKSMNGKIDQLLIKIAGTRMDNARNPSPQSTPVPPTIKASPEVTSPARQSSTALLTNSSRNIGITVSQTRPAVTVMPANPKSSNNNETGIADMWTALEKAKAYMASGNFSSDSESEDEKEYSSGGWSEDEKESSSDDWSEYEKGYIPPPPRMPLPPLPVTSNNHVTDIASESSNNDETGTEDARTVVQKTGSTVVSGERNSTDDDYDGRVRGRQTVVQEFRLEQNSEELFPNKSVVQTW